MKASIFLILLALLALPAAAAEVEVHVRLEPEVIGLDETATFSIEVSGGGFSSLRFRPDFQLDNLEIVSGPSQYEDMRWVNGSFSRTVRWAWEVRPLRVGRARVYDIGLQVRGEVVQLQPRELRVQREPTQARRSYGPDEEEEDDPFQQFFGQFPRPWRREPEQPEVFLRAELQPQKPVVGQQVLYSLYLYTRENIAALSPSGVPAFRGFWVQDVPIPQQIPTEMVEIDGRRYGRVPLLRKALFPLRPGRLKVDPASVDLTVEHYERSLFFTPPIARPEALRLQSDAQWVDVQPLPPAPPGFGGAVGQLALTADLEPKQVRLGEAATLTVHLSGAGNLQGIPEPKIAPPAGVTLYPPQQEGKDGVSGNQVRGDRIWKYVVVPERAGRYTLETPEVTYFDPASRQYRVAAAPDFSLAALPRPTATESGSGSSEPHGIRTAVLPARSPAGAHWTGLLPWLFILPWGLALMVTLARRRSAQHPIAPVPAAGSAQGFEEKLREAEAEERPRQVAQRVEEAWREVLSERWDVPAATSPPHWVELLALRGVAPDSLDELRRLLEDVQYLRYAPQLSATEALRAEVIARSRRLLRRMS